MGLDSYSVGKARLFQFRKIVVVVRDCGDCFLRLNIDARATIVCWLVWCGGVGMFHHIGERGYFVCEW